ncbi:DUF3310 domain-containing protein [Streptomyces sp. NPDC057686]|uniref:DUF3310 domain-containing protein n=1 Tax=Streptomyces sp. NPDC057686 TaxID=3346212 RepID=UPI003677AE1E
MISAPSGPPKEASPRDRQVGGTHYSDLPIQPFDIIDAYGLDFYEGCALKYLLRYRKKGGAEDLRKCAHYLEILIERYEKEQPFND